MVITSSQNPRLKHLLSLRDHRHRRETQTFLVEGARECKQALAAGFHLDELYFCPELISKLSQDILAGIQPQKLFEVAPQAFHKLVVRESTDGLAAVFRARDTTLNELHLPAIPLLMICSGVEKPGNLGALLRTADGAGVNAVLVCDSNLDIFNPNIIRASLGAVFSLPIVCCSASDAIAYCRQRQVALVAASLKGTSEYFKTDFRLGVAIVLGSEAQGLSDDWLNAAKQIKIPMVGKMDSLNVSAAGAVLLYDVFRQRNE